MNLPGNVLVFSEKTLEVKLYEREAWINGLIEKCAAFTRKKVQSQQRPRLNRRVRSLLQPKEP